MHKLISAAKVIPGVVCRNSRTCVKMASGAAAEIKPKLINEVNEAVSEHLQGFISANPHVRRLQGFNVVLRNDFDKQRVALMSGGGSGHEPLFACFIGRGMLTAGVAGKVFASPAPSQISAALKAIDNPAGVLVFVLNYTGDQLNFGLAVERFRSAGGRVRMVTCADDAAFPEPDKLPDRRGLAATLFLLKIAGALSEEGKDVDVIADTSERVRTFIGTIGMSLSSCSQPGGGPLFHLAPGTMELGLGMHGEAGAYKAQFRSSVDAVDQMMTRLTLPDSASGVRLTSGSEVAVLLNNLGSVTTLEMNIVTRDLLCWFQEREVRVRRFYCGALVTSLEMQGISISVLRLPTGQEWPDNRLLELLDADAQTSSWPRRVCLPPGSVYAVEPIAPSASTLSSAEVDWNSFASVASLGPEETKKVEACVRAACETVIRSERELNAMDAAVGDGDTGTALAFSSKEILKKLDGGSLDPSRPSVLLEQISRVFEDTAGGTTGPIYGLLFQSLSRSVRESVCWASVQNGVADALSTITQLGGAQPGHRTLVDTLVGAVKGMKGGMEAAVEGAEEGARLTTGMRARAGRGRNVAPEQYLSLGHPDPGAHALALWFRAVLVAFRS